MRRALPFLVLVALGATPTPTPAPASAPQTAADVLARAGANSESLHSYQVPVTVKGSVRVSIVSLPIGADGTEYFKSPNKEAMHLNNVPSMARGFSNTMTNMGTPQTWQANYDITLTGTTTHHNHLAFVLVGTPKNAGNVKTVTMWINTKTYAIQTVTFAYNNGSTLVLELSHHGLSPYHLPTSIAVSAHFPGYSGQAQIVYGTYQVNVAIPDSVFTQQ